MKGKFNLDEKMDRLERELKEKIRALKVKLTPKFVKENRKKKEEKIDAIDLTALTKPVNDAETSGPKKMKDFMEHLLIQQDKIFAQLKLN